MFLTDHFVEPNYVEHSAPSADTQPWLQVRIFRRAEPVYSIVRTTPPESREQKRNRLIAECCAIARADVAREAKDPWVHDVSD